MVFTQMTKVDPLNFESSSEFRVRVTGLLKFLDLKELRFRLYDSRSAWVFGGFKRFCVLKLEEFSPDLCDQICFNIFGFWRILFMIIGNTNGICLIYLFYLFIFTFGIN